MVDEGASLTIAPGANLEFEAGVALQIQGVLVSEGTENARVMIRNVAGEGNFGGIFVYDGEANLAYTSIINGGGADLGFDDLRANVVIGSFASTDDKIGSVSFGQGMEHSGAPYGVAFDNWPGSAGTTFATGCDGMAPIYWPYPEDKGGQCD